jgi:CRP-like cAMP-binding protein
MLDMLSTKVLHPGDYVFREGEPGDFFYMIEEGMVECLKSSSENPAGMFGQAEETLVRTLHEGDHFGELALLT